MLLILLKSISDLSLSHELIPCIYVKFLLSPQQIIENGCLTARVFPNL